MSRLFSFLTNGFPIWVLTGSIVALFFPSTFSWFGPYVVPGLALIMLGMGMTISVEDLKSVANLPKAGIVGVLAQFAIMPLLGFGVAKLMGLHEIDPYLAVGLILVSCCPGGTASNVIAYLAGADVALSVLMTIVSTFAAIILTPLLTMWLAGAMVEVSAFQLFAETVKVVAAPVGIGILLNHFSPLLVAKMRPFSPFLSVVAIVLIVAYIIGANNETILQSGWKLLAAPAILHLLAFLLGYLAAWLIGLPESARRTISIEVGMQNSGLGTTLAKSTFPGTLATVPCAISAVYHCLIGSLLAGFWRLRPAGFPNGDENSLGADPE